jgi:UDP-N-acetylmuramoyl-L-alanyl-D-glutamate--2,6-diaminopimelate ligase
LSVRLDALLRGLALRISGDPAIEVSDVTYDSRKVEPGSLFVALRGNQTDGHRFAQSAIEAGAAALLVEKPPARVPAGVPVAIVRDTRAALGEVAARLYGYPARDMTLIGVTGTNGKTSTVRLIEAILSSAGRRAGSIGTISVRFAGHEEPASLTTPEAADLQRNLARMRDAKIESVALEVSSHSLALGRVRPLRFAVAVFTHLSQDHLDFHGDMDRYGEAKAQLFGAPYLAGTAVLNARDPISASLAERANSAGARVLHFARGEHEAADLCSVEETIRLEGSRIAVAEGAETHPIDIPLPGDFQVENALAAIAATRALDVGWEAIAAGIGSCPPVPGRLERVPSDELVVLVDYAHTPDALDRVLARVRPLVRGRLITVFGCGGDRDRSKRPRMARAACRHSDYVIATSDNPRTEDPDAILRDVRAGLDGAHEVVRDRRAAITRAIEIAKPDDAVVIAGKGHEDYQIVGHEKIDFDDRVEAARALRARGERA